MRARSLTISLMAAALAGGMPALAQQPQADRSGRPPVGAADAGNDGASNRAGATVQGAQGAALQTGSDALAQAIHSDDLIGATVRGAADEDVGKVNALLIGKDARVVGVVVEVGGFLGVGARQVVVPMDQLGVIDDDNVRMQSATREQLERAPVYRRRDPQGG